MQGFQGEPSDFTLRKTTYSKENMFHMALFCMLVLVGGWYILTTEVPDEAKLLAKDF
jgi:hypothetical protein